MFDATGVDLVGIAGIIEPCPLENPISYETTSLGYCCEDFTIYIKFNLNLIL